VSVTVLIWPLIVWLNVVTNQYTRASQFPETPFVTGFRLTSPHLALRANPYPEVTDLSCRLPLPTLFYRLEAAHLGHLLRRSVRLWLVRKNVLNRGSSHTFQGVKKGHRTRRRSPCSPRFLTASPRNASAAISKSLSTPSRLIRKDNSSRASRYRHVVHLNASPLRLRSLLLIRHSAGILTCFPFGANQLPKIN